MRTILFVETGGGFGGSATCLDRLIACLDPAAYRCIVAHMCDGPVIRRMRREGRETVRLRPGRALWDLVRLIRREGVDVVHGNNEIYSHSSTILAARLTGRPCLLHMRAIRPLTRRERWLIPFVDHFLIISEAGRRVYVEEGVPEGRATTLYDGLDPSRFDTAGGGLDVRKSLGIAEDDLVVGIVSRLIPAKGHVDFLDALSRLVRTHPRLVGVVVGADPEPGEPFFQALAQQARGLGFEDRVRFLGWHDDIREITSALDIAVQASRCPEGLGMAIIEAMVLGKPVVATAVGGIPEVVAHEQTGFLVPPAHPAALASAIGRFAEDEALRQQFGQAARRRAEALFDQRRQTREIETIYEKLLS